MDGQRSIDGGGGGIHHGRQEADVDMAALQIPPQGGGYSSNKLLPRYIPHKFKIHNHRTAQFNSHAHIWGSWEFLNNKKIQKH